MMIRPRITQAIRRRIEGFQRYKVIIVLAALMLFYCVNKISIGGGITFSTLKMEDENHPIVALTFDDGPHRYYSEKLVEILGKEKVRATFFVVGKMVKKYPDLVKAEFLAGHEIGNHTYSDLRITMMSKEKAIEEIEKTQDLIVKVTGKPTSLLRPPGGHYNGTVVDIAMKYNYEIVLWTINSNDIVSPPAWKIYDRVTSVVHDEDIVVFHDGIESTLEALPSIIEYLKRKGFKFVTVSELLKIKRERIYADSRY